MIAGLNLKIKGGKKPLKKKLMYLISSKVAQLKS